MYKKILVPLENSPTDATVLAHVRALAEHTGAALVLIHVADGWVARNIEQLQLRESDEIREDRAYLDRTLADLRAAGFDAVSITPTHEVAPGMHSAIVKATKPAAATR